MDVMKAPRMTNAAHVMQESIHKKWLERSAQTPAERFRIHTFDKVKPMVSTRRGSNPFFSQSGKKVQPVTANDEKPQEAAQSEATKLQ